jgi:hypothetical protein
LELGEIEARVEGGVQIGQQRVQDETFLYRNDLSIRIVGCLFAASGMKPETPIRRRVELDVITIRPARVVRYRWVDDGAVDIANAGKLIGYDLGLVAGLCFIVDVLPLAAAATRAAGGGVTKVGAG